MNPLQALGVLTAYGIELTARDGKLYASPQGKVTKKLTKLINDHRPGLLSVLTQSDRSVRPAAYAHGANRVVTPQVDATIETSDREPPRMTGRSVFDRMTRGGW